MSSDNIFEFKRPKPPGPASDEPPAEYTPDDVELVESITSFVKFMLDNRHAIRGFVAAVALDNVDNPDADMVCHAFASPIEARDFALLLKILDNTFYKNLNGYM